MTPLHTDQIATPALTFQELFTMSKALGYTTFGEAGVQEFFERPDPGITDDFDAMC